MSFWLETKDSCGEICSQSEPHELTTEANCTNSGQAPSQTNWRARTPHTRTNFCDARCRSSTRVPISATICPSLCTSWTGPGTARIPHLSPLIATQSQHIVFSPSVSIVLIFVSEVCASASKCNWVCASANPWIQFGSFVLSFKFCAQCLLETKVKFCYSQTKLRRRGSCRWKGTTCSFNPVLLFRLRSSFTWWLAFIHSSQPAPRLLPAPSQPMKALADPVFEATKPIVPTVSIRKTTQKYLGHSQTTSSIFHSFLLLVWCPQFQRSSQGTRVKQATQHPAWQCHIKVPNDKFIVEINSEKYSKVNHCDSFVNHCDSFVIKVLINDFKHS